MPEFAYTARDGSGAALAGRLEAGSAEAAAEMQQGDGSFKSVNERWMENDPVLITAYGLIAVGEAMK